MTWTYQQPDGSVFVGDGWFAGWMVRCVGLLLEKGLSHGRLHSRLGLCIPHGEPIWPWGGMVSPHEPGHRPWETEHPKVHGIYVGSHNWLTCPLSGTR